MICKEQGRARGPPSEKIVPFSQKHGILEVRFSRAERWAVRMDDGIFLFHGSREEVVYPEIRITRYTKDFSWGFYCTKSYQQAYRWADRRSADGIVNAGLHRAVPRRSQSPLRYCRGANGGRYNLGFCQRFYFRQNFQKRLLGICTLQTSDPPDQFPHGQCVALPDL